MARGDNRTKSAVVCLFLLVSLLAGASAGATWFPDIRLTDYSLGSYLSGNGARCMAADYAGNVYLVWSDTRDGNAEIYFKRFDGATWGPDRRVTGNSGASETPAVAVDPVGDLHLAWADGSAGYPAIRYKRFDGVSWTPVEVLTSGSTISGQPSIAADQAGNVHLVWWNTETGQSCIYYSMFNGSAWSEPEILTGPAAVSASTPCIDVDQSGGLHVVWEDFRDGNVEVYYKEFDGVGWSADRRLTTSPAWSRDPCVVADANGDIFVFWNDETGPDSEIHYTRRVGAVWGADSLLIPGFGKASAPSAVAVDSGEVRVVWHDSPSGDTEIYYKEFDGVWGADIRLTEAAEASEDPHIALDASGHLHVAWRDEREGLPLIHCRWWYNGTPPEPEISSLDPVEWATGDGIRIGALEGANFLYGAWAWLQRSGEDSITMTNVGVDASDLITCTLSLAGAATGWWDLVVSNPDGKMDTLADAFHVLPPIWSEDTRLTSDGASSRLPVGNARTIAVDSDGHLHVVWHDDRTGQNEVYYKTYDGVTWSADEHVTLGSNIADNPSIAIDPDDNIHMVWEGGPYSTFRTYYSERSDTGWTGALLLSESDYGWSPSVAVDTAGDVFAAWNGHNGVWARRFDGVAWGPEWQFDTPWIDRYPALAAGPDGRVHMVWQADDTTKGQWLRYSEFDGVEWSPYVTLETAAYLAFPSIAVDCDNNVHVSWHDMRFGSAGHLEVWYKKRDGASWLASERLTFADGWSHRSSIAVDDEANVYVAWADERGEIQEIYYKRFDGIGWGPSVRLTFDAAGSINPHTVVDGDGRLHLIWSDERDGNQEIYYKMYDPGMLAGVSSHDGQQQPFSGLKVVPNPLQGSGKICFSLQDDSAVDLRIYDIRGRLVWRSGPGQLSRGRQSVTWHGRDMRGNPVSPGIYFCTLSADRQTIPTKLVLVR